MTTDPTPRSGAAQKPAIEARSIDHVPADERHGKVWHVVPVWVAGNANAGTVAVGAIGIALGANLFWTLLAITLGCAFGTIFAALHSTQGPQLGLPQLIQSRPQFGYLGALLVFALALVNYVGFNVFTNVLAASSLTTTVHWSPTWSFVVASLVAGLIALAGYDWIHRISRYVTVGFLLVFAVLTLGLVGAHGVSLAPGHFALTTFLLQFGAAAGYQINWSIYVSDYTRYLPEDASPRAMFWATYLGMTVSAVWLAGLGAVMAAAFNAADAVSAIKAAGEHVLGGFGTVAVLVALAGLLLGAAMNAYGGALTFISVIACFRTVEESRALRLIAVVVVTVLALVLSLRASANFLTDFGTFLTMLLYLFAPWTAINLTDYFVVRRGHYAIADIFDPHGQYGLVNARGLFAYCLGIVAEVPFMSMSWYTGPVATALKGADLSPFAGVIVGAVVYWLLNRNLDPTRSEARPVPAIS